MTIRFLFQDQQPSIKQLEARSRSDQEPAVSLAPEQRNGSHGVCGPDGWR